MLENHPVLPLEKWWKDTRFLTTGEKTVQRFFSQLGVTKDQELLLYNLVLEAERVHEILCFIGGVITIQELRPAEEKVLSDNGVFLQRINIQLRSALGAMQLAKEGFSNHFAVGDNVIKNINHSMKMVAEMLGSIYTEMEDRPQSDKVYE